MEIRKRDEIMTNLPVQPRPCTLWGSTFDARDFCEIHINTKYSAHRAINVLSHDITILAQTREEMPTGLSINAEHELMKPLMIEAVTAIHNALHPPLDLAHALEVNYDFNQHDFYLWFGATESPIWNNSPDTLLQTTIRTKESLQRVFEGSGRITNYGGFIPCNQYGQPIQQGEAEAVVKAWEGNANG